MNCFPCGSLIGITSARTITFAIPSRFLTGAAARGGLALINSVGAFGGFVGSFAVDWLKIRPAASASP